MNWTPITDIGQLDEISADSFNKPIVIFKHSSRCAISSMALQRLEREYTDIVVQFYFLDLIKYRHISNMIAEKFEVFHESPQILLIKNGVCVFEESHIAIRFSDIIEQL